MYGKIVLQDTQSVALSDDYKNANLERIAMEKYVRVSFYAD
jgi:hypothetical protein